MQIGISTGVCFPFLKGKLQQVKLLSEFREMVDGLEIIFPRPLDLVNFNPKGRARALAKQFGFVTIHYPFPKHVRLSALPEKRLLAKLGAIDRELPIKHVVLHPGSAKSWKPFKESGLVFLLENQRYGKNRRWRTPISMKALLDETGFGMCLDLNHAMGWGIKPEKFLLLGKRIRQVHVNATEAFGSESHRFVSESSPKAAGLAKNALSGLKHAVWMIEAKSPVSPRRKIEREIAFLESI